MRLIFVFFFVFAYLSPQGLQAPLLPPLALSPEGKGFEARESSGEGQKKKQKQNQHLP